MTLKQILSLVSSKLPPSFDRENVAADLWIKAWIRQREQGSQVGTYTDQIDPPLSASVIHNRCVDEMRKRKRDEKLNENELIQETQPIKDEINLYISDIIERSNLSRQAQRVVMEKFFLGSSLKLIAEHLDLRPEEVQRILHQTLERLRAVAREVKTQD